MMWSVPRMWEGQAAAILASGPSMSQEVADAVKGLRTIAVNNTYQLAPWADILYAADERWWAVHKAEALKFAGLKVTLSEGCPKEVLRLNNTGVTGFDPNPANLRTGGNGGCQAVQIAVHAGANPILLCGFDMHGGHWHKDHPHPLRNTEEAGFMRWLNYWKEFAHEMKMAGVTVINCTPGSALKSFPMMDLREAIESTVSVA